MKLKPSALSFNFTLVFLSGIRSKEFCFYVSDDSCEYMQMNWGWKVKKVCFGRDIPDHPRLHHSYSVLKSIWSGTGPEILITNISTHLYHCHWCRYQQPLTVLPKGCVMCSRSFTLLFWTLIPFCAIDIKFSFQWSIKSPCNFFIHLIIERSEHKGETPMRTEIYI